MTSHERVHVQPTQSHVVQIFREKSQRGDVTGFEIPLGEDVAGASSDHLAHGFREGYSRLELSEILYVWISGIVGENSTAFIALIFIYCDVVYWKASHRDDLFNFN